jgi:hypothetical protein
VTDDKVMEEINEEELKARTIEVLHSAIFAMIFYSLANTTTRWYSCRHVLRPILLVLVDANYTVSLSKLFWWKSRMKRRQPWTMDTETSIKAIVKENVRPYIITEYRLKSS